MVRAVVAVVVLDPAPAVLVAVVALVVLLLQVLARLLREAQFLRPAAVPLPQKAGVAALLVLVQGLVASESLGRR